MKRILQITKIMLKTATSPLAEMTNSKSEMSKATKVFIWVSLGIALLSMIAVFGSIAGTLIRSFNAFNQAYYAVYLFLLVLSALSLFMGLIITPSLYYFDDTIEDYLVLPITRVDFLSAKWLVNAYSISLINLPLIIVFLFQFFNLTDMTLLNIPVLIIASLLVPLIPISALVFITVLLFKAVPFIRNKNAYVYFTTILSMFLGIGISMFGSFQTDPAILLETLEQGLQGSGNTLLSLANYTIPSMKFFMNGLLEQSFIPFILGFLVTFAIIALTVWFTKYNYLDSVLSMSEISQKTKKLSSKHLAKQSAQRSPIKALMRQDFRNIIRTPIFASNYFLPMIIIPVSLVFGILSSGESMPTLEDLKQLSFLFNELLAEFKFFELISFTAGLSVVLGYVTGSFSTMSSTAISREGTNMQNFLQMPIQFENVIYAKILLGTITTAILPMVFLIFLQFVLRAPLHLFIIAFVFLLLGALSANIFSIIFDVIKPKLVWSTEQEAVKSNLLSVVPMFISFGVIGFSVFILINSADAPIIAIPLLILIVASLSFLYIKKKGVEHLRKAIQSM